ncbi:ricin-type beta-trefoil lectin domain protein [Kribbella lupini]|uniref:Ricin B lectin domain-containing protein n=1 Tax=Kribbella lupini TaxID=291602 RepID=A0ABP4NHB4_9ACTN
MPGPHVKKRVPAWRPARAVSAVVAVLAASLVVPPTNAFAVDPSGLDYVAMGSSYAAGPGVPPVQTSTGAATCSRSANNYPSFVARDIGANLRDVSCSGATTANVLTTNQSGLPPQVQAVTSTTRVVTITIGGNDVNYLGSMYAYSCQTSGGSNCATVDQNAINQTFPALAGRLESIVNAVRATAPQAKVYLVNYFTTLPDAGVCANVPLTADQATFERSIASRLAAATATAATTTGATLVDLAAASRGHNACSADPWLESYYPAAGRVGYHPNEAGMKAAAALVETALGTNDQARKAAFRSGIAGKCLDVRSSDPANGTPVQLYTCNGTTAQQWTYTPGSTGGTLRALGSCLDVTASGTANKTKIQLWQCNGAQAQRWVPGPNSSLINPQSGRCLDDPGSSTVDGTQLQIYDCNGANAQKWTPSV